MEMVTFVKYMELKPYSGRVVQIGNTNLQLKVVELEGDREEVVLNN